MLDNYLFTDKYVLNHYSLLTKDLTGVREGGSQ